ncbi:MAG: glucosyltransferase domain-containing protein [Lachnospiraceae bacterium]|nr:glucosyltransferase domain-containing protein [Lachnospiraceae bacterium]
MKGISEMIEMRNDVLALLGRKIPRHTRICLQSGMLVGWLTHFYMLSHKLPNWDDGNNMNNFGSGDYLGRWFLKYIHPLGGRGSIPAVHGFLLIVCIAISACLILEILQIRSATGAVLTAAVLETFPSVVSTMTFMFMAHTSGIGILMVVLAVYLLRKYRFGWLPCTVFLICVLGIYQSYISFAITLMLLGMISDIFHGKKFPEILKKGIVCILVLGIGVLVYMKLSHVIYPNLDNETYGGVGNMGQIAIREMPTLIGRCYKRFLEYFLWKPFAFVSSTAQAANIITCILAAVLFTYLVITRKMYQDILTFLMLVLLCGFVPLAAAFIYFMAPEVAYSMLMLYAYALIYVTVLALLEYCMEDWQDKPVSVKWRNGLRYMAVIVTVCTIFVSSYTDYLLANRAYLRTHLAAERVQQYFNRVIAMVENTEGYESGDRIEILGEFYYKDNPSTVEVDILDSEDLRELDGVALENGLITTGVRDNIIKMFVGYDMADLSFSDKQDIMETEEYKNMAVYPKAGCVQKINEIWVVKMCE